MQDISPSASTTGQYIILGLALVVHIYVAQAFFRRLHWPPKVNQANALFFLVVAVAIPISQITTCFYVQAQTATVNGTADPTTIQYFTAWSKFANFFIGLYGLTTVHLSHLVLILMKPVAPYHDLWAVAQVLYAAFIYLSWLSSSGIILYTLRKCHKVLRASMDDPSTKKPPSKCASGVDMLKGVVSKLPETRIVFAILLLIRQVSIQQRPSAQSVSKRQRRRDGLLLPKPAFGRDHLEGCILYTGAKCMDAMFVMAECL
ncbi:uncharacterized protein BJ171DRAFT_521394 [Polychytrium aggregatum]|uniref:uncharacterized protein n=1 Tax=Polychytrium aggregatum TaxID=110093 RepID=UPI0022FECD88|nr:uncharacterized protein BJ171DRAFT_521394 [Polychytrium aggregatum]KAI9197170.1 hypothetical protein BJ171DRAFT_521394 [Polychytrium aggregatum]